MSFKRTINLGLQISATAFAIIVLTHNTELFHLLDRSAIRCILIIGALSILLDGGIHTIDINEFRSFMMRSTRIDLAWLRKRNYEYIIYIMHKLYLTMLILIGIALIEVWH